MNIIAIIPARGGSKRIPRKNIKPFRGNPIISYSIETALKSLLFNEVMVSTDDEEIALISKKCGAVVPFFRDPSTSGDYTITADVILEVITQYKKMGNHFDYACCIYPTAPLIMMENLNKGFELLKENSYTTVFPICAFSHPIYRSLRINEDGMIEMIWPENINVRSQNLPDAYFDAGQFYWIHVESFLIEPKLYTTNSGAIILDQLQVQDIDNETDWKIAELKHASLFQCLPTRNK